MRMDIAKGALNILGSVFYYALFYCSGLVNGQFSYICVILCDECKLAVLS